MNRAPFPPGMTDPASPNYDPPNFMAHTLAPPSPTQWMTAAEIDAFVVHGAPPPPRVNLAPPPPPPHTCTWCAPGETGPCICRPPLPNLPPMTAAQEAAHEARVAASAAVFHARHAPPPPPPVARVPRVFDVETYVNYFLVKFYNPAEGFTKFVLNAWTPLDAPGLVRMLLSSQIIGFNSANYDVPMVAAVLAGYTNAQLKTLTNAIIQPNNQGMKPWELEREFGLKPLTFLDHIDLIEVMPGVASLKAYGGKMHCKKLQDLPIPHDTVLTLAQMQIIDDYNDNDLITTWAGYEKFKLQLDLRAEMTIENGIDLRSKSDAQIAEAIFKKQLPGGEYLKPPYIPPGTQFFYKPPSFIKFRTPKLQVVLDMVLRSPFTISDKGAVMPTDELKRAQVQIGGTTYQLGYGGLHSCEKTINHIANDDTSLEDIDVISWYPLIIIICELFPPQIGRAFLLIFKGWVEHRIAAKKAGKKKQADGEKTKINGTFGKTGSRYSILNAPSLMIQVTITGQLSLLMLIEHLEGAGIAVVSANTDGIVIKCPRHLHGLRDMIVMHWQSAIGVETEAVNYRAIYSRDVNNYLAFKDDGSVKMKGEAFAPPEPVGPSWPNPTNEICVDAVVAYILDGTPIAQTIRMCPDIRKFVSVRAVAGGGQWHPSASAPPQYLGKAVRWYYARGCEQSTINYVTNGNKVAKSEGSKPCMELPDTLPTDINYAWYEQEANEKLRSIGL